MERLKLSRVPSSEKVIIRLEGTIMGKFLIILRNYLNLTVYNTSMFPEEKIEKI